VRIGTTDAIDYEFVVPTVQERQLRVDARPWGATRVLDAKQDRIDEAAKRREKRPEPLENEVEQWMHG